MENRSQENEIINSKNFIDWNDFKSSLLIEVFRDKEIYTSSAVLIKRNVLLTAAHCVDGITKGYVHLGNEYSQNNIRISFKKVIIHSEYNKEESNFKNDIALIILDNSLPTSYRPAKIAKSTPREGEELERLGFGARFGVNKRTWTNPRIKSIRSKALELSDSSSVVGDSGGPIFCNKKLVGIHSTKEGNKTYAVKVLEFNQWIEDNLPLKSI